MHPKSTHRSFMKQLLDNALCYICWFIIFLRFVFFYVQVAISVCNQCTEEHQRTRITSCYDSRKISPRVGSPVLPRSRTQAPSNHQQSPALSHRTCNHSTGLRNCQLRKDGYHLLAFWTFPDNYMRLFFPFFCTSAVNYWKTRNLESLK